jgi:predicted nucleic acid-binding protein
VVVVDTSVWIEAFRKPARLRIEDLVDPDEVVLALPIVQEILQGFRDERAFGAARESLLAFPIVDSPMTEEVFLTAAQIYRAARRAGLTPRSSVDCLIAASALRHGLTVLHRDRDYDLLGRVSALQSRSV